MLDVVPPSLTDQLRLSASPDWAQPWLLPHPIRMMGDHVARLVSLSVRLASGLAGKAPVRVTFTSDGVAKDDWWTGVRMTFKDGKGDDIAALARKAADLMPEICAPDNHLRGLRYAASAPGVLSTVACLGVAYPLLSGDRLRDLALENALKVPDWKRGTGQRDEDKARQKLSDAMDARLVLYRRSVLQQDAFAMALLDLFGLDYDLREDVLTCEDAYAYAVAAFPQPEPATIDIPNNVTVALGGTMLCG